MLNFSELKKALDIIRSKKSDGTRFYLVLPTEITANRPTIEIRAHVEITDSVIGGRNYDETRKYAASIVERIADEIQDVIADSRHIIAITETDEPYILFDVENPIH